MTGKTFTLEEIAKHNKPDDCWIIIDNKVYDVTKFAPEHPGGKAILVKSGGKDATKQFNMFHKAEAVIRAYGPKLYIGDVAGGSVSAPPAPGSALPQPKSLNKSGPPSRRPSIVRAPGPNAYGEMVPYGDPSWYQEWNSPYYKESHLKLRTAIRAFVDKEIAPYVHEWDEAKQMPKEIFKKAYEAGLLPLVCGPPVATKYLEPGWRAIGDLDPKEYDPFHELILIDEICRAGSGGVAWGLFGGLSIGLPPVALFGSQYLKDKVVAPCIKGEKVICLAITEPQAGSDVANITTTAVKSPCGKFYIVNGEKKWITNGVFADFFTVAVRTGGPGMGGISMLLVERSFGGITTNQMKCSGVWPSGTTYIAFEDVKVPVENLIGKENEGFKYVMYNFNHERWAIVVQSTRFARVCLEEAMRYSFKRSTFGKKLIEHPVIRLKLAHMARQVEATQSWLELITYQLATLPKNVAADVLAGPIALAKAQASTVFEFCAREAAQIFGGLAYTRGGQGEKVERLYREVRAFAIPGGSEEIMLDLGVRQASRGYMAQLMAKL